MTSLDRIVGVGVGLLITFLFVGSIIGGFFDDFAEVNLCRSNSTNVIACTNCNETTEDSDGYEDYIESCHSMPLGQNSTGDTIPDVAGVSQNNTHCFGCGDWGERTTTRNLGLVIFAIGMMAFAFVFLPTRR